MAHLEGPDLGLKLWPKGRQQGLQSEELRPSEFNANYGLSCPQWVIMCVTPTSKEHSTPTPPSPSPIQMQLDTT
ncbi:hypothetical protein HispidOSU_010761, partial [Sigmodon hispidus]